MLSIKRIIPVLASVVLISSFDVGAAEIEWQLTRALNPVFETNSMWSSQGGGLLALTTDKRILFTEDGLSWTSDASAPSDWMLQRAAGNEDVWVIFSGTRAYTRNNATGEWTVSYTRPENELPRPDNSPPFGVTYGAGQFLIIDDLGCLVSEDGYAWTRRELEGDVTTTYLNALTYANGFYWLPMAKDIGFSEDGVSWSRIKGSGLLFTSPIFHDGDTYVTRVMGVLARSVDGKIWGTEQLASNQGTTMMALNGTALVSVEPREKKGHVLVKGQSWQSIDFEGAGVDLETVVPSALIQYDGQFILYFYEEMRDDRLPDALVLVSEDGIEWERPESGPIVGASFVGDQFFAYGRGLLERSSDGFNWSPVNWSDGVTLLSDETFVGVAIGGGRFLALGSSVAYSDDGSVWHLTEALDDKNKELRFTRVGGYSHGFFYAIGATAAGSPALHSKLYRSEDGLVWTAVSISGTGSLVDHALFCTDEAVVVFAGEFDISYWSKNGDHWSSLPGSWLWIDQVGDQFIAASDDMTLRKWVPGTPVVQVSEEMPGELLDSGFVIQEQDLWIFTSKFGYLYSTNELDQPFQRHRILRLSFLTRSATSGNGAIVLATAAGLITGKIMPPIVTPWSNAKRYLNGWVESVWYGWLFDGMYPWVYHTEAGWVYQIMVEGEDSLYAWDTGLNAWTWFGKDTYPAIYVHGAGVDGWLHHERGSVTPGRWFYDYSSGEWVEEWDIAGVAGE